MNQTSFAKLSVFFPMWNEQDYIERAVEAAREECEALLAENDIADYEIIIVNDASTDRTGEMADALAASDPRVRVVHHPENRKLGGSMKSGFAAATGDLVLYTDADLPFDMHDVHKAMRLLRYYEADVVSAYRFDRTGEGYVRTVYSFFYNMLVRVLFGVRMRDINFAFIPINLSGNTSSTNRFSISAASFTISTIRFFASLFSSFEYKRTANSVCSASSRLMNSFDNVNPGINPRFFTQ